MLRREIPVKLKRYQRERYNFQPLSRLTFHKRELRGQCVFPIHKDKGRGDGYNIYSFASESLQPNERIPVGRRLDGVRFQTRANQ